MNPLLCHTWGAGTILRSEWILRKNNYRSGLESAINAANNFI